MTHSVPARISLLVSLKFTSLSVNQLALTSHPVEYVILRALFSLKCLVKLHCTGGQLDELR